MQYKRFSCRITAGKSFGLQESRENDAFSAACRMEQYHFGISYRGFCLVQPYQYAKNRGGRSLQFLLYLNGHRRGGVGIGFPGCAQSDAGALRQHLRAERPAAGRCRLAGRGTEDPNSKTIQRKSDEIFPDLQCGNLWLGCRTSAVWRRQYQKHFRGMAAGGAARAGAICMGLPLYRIRLQRAGFPPDLR